jgi:hypothetical protein
MSQEAAFFNAYFQSPPKVLGQNLKPFSIWHKIALTRAGNPFAVGGITNKADLIEAVQICSHTHQEFLGLFYKWSTVLALWTWKRKLKQCNWQEEEAAFVDYLKEGVVNPRLKPASHPGRPPGAPIELTLLNCLQRNLHLSEEDALNYPYAAALWRWASLHEEDGACCIYNEAELDFLEFARQQDELAAAENREVQ